MAKRSTVFLTTGEAGSGKTYVRCARFIFEFFADEKNGVLISNYPVNIEETSTELEKRFGGSAQDYENRLLVIPESILLGWQERFERKDTYKCKGPWTFFGSIPASDFQDGSYVDKYPDWAGVVWPDHVRVCDDPITGDQVATFILENRHVAIDEIHNFVKDSTPKHQREKWSTWLGEIRHRGATIEFITQHPSKLAKEIKAEAAEHLCLTNMEVETDPFFGIQNRFWFELFACFTRQYRGKTRLTHLKSKVQKNGVVSWGEASKPRVYELDPFYFKFYNSFNSPFSGGGGAASHDHEYQLRSVVGVLFWFLRRTWSRLLPRVIIACLILWLLVGGGFKMLLSGFMTSISGFDAGNVSSKIVDSCPYTVKDVANNTGIVKKPVTVAKSTGFKNLVISSNISDPNNIDLLKDYKILLVTPDSFTDSRLITYRIGDTVNFGKIKGFKVVAIDWKKRAVKFNDDTVLFMRYPDLDDNGVQDK